MAERLEAQGIGVTVVDPRWVKPLDPALVGLARDHRLVVSIEDNGRVGGVGAALLQLLTDEGVTTPFSLHGIPQEFLHHAERQAILDRIGLNAQTIARGIVERLAAEGHEPLPDHRARSSRLVRVGSRQAVREDHVVARSDVGDRHGAGIRRHPAHEQRDEPGRT